MSDPKQPVPMELSVYAQDPSGPRVTGIEVIALALTVLWLGAVAVFFLSMDEGQGAAGGATLAMTMLAILMPVALIWVAASAARTARVMREEAARLQSSIDAMRAAYMDNQQRSALDMKPEMVRKLEEIAEAQRSTDVKLATFTSMRAQGVVSETRAAVAPAALDEHQASLGLGTPADALKEPISVADFVKALNFPENEHDKEGFRTLRRALEDRSTERLVRASQDVLTLLSQDGIYMDDLRPDRARPEIWRKFAQGDRGRAVAPLGGIHDRSSLALAAGRMKQDPVFRDAVHHFLRQFDHTFLEFEKHASDEEVARLAETRTARAFMLLGRVTGTFD
ncbi:hypothetical protein GTA62_10265 [Roseobacter sp. HKCCD9010]|uniref:hypothetical protein n=1 Tax=unclassified Roseobacter TaxID=196798 RepID=UPI0014913806|nr:MULTISPECIES: hypothetical protein [unclassified Roseobacter]MBF9050907.1 hypothetical protein [Rhodobacterales bacterium HKCCD4356]NNV12676.1 hypothetical protein [Roseobacter sp. HKCCD7357]NNV16620.1 hypothetical protein [Roseobacter sp. HKCCD8768]NNV26748.1 hypothetical protein [Roseobacter sp. HKCCD8192]NNV30339.1 hypothetical protein [Roseobacter sp. HKCCD9061]